MKKLFSSLLAAASVSAFAASEHDGVYLCTTTLFDETAQVYFSFHTKENGVSGLIASAPFSTTAHGYSIGSISGNTFTGTNPDGSTTTIEMGYSFSFRDKYDWDGVQVPVTFSCFKIF